ncbi:MAG: histidine phosphatase family protein [Rhodospirillales bacterium 20-64-7]|nr:MAG: histidine phosphatase family protein [Rhodospirillales bacterium 20-64-7]
MFLLRHGQSLFNLHFSETRVDPGIEDPELTPLGHAQAEAAAERLAEVPVSRLIISPFTRALQTAQPILARHDVPVEVMHVVRERAAFVCDIGRHPAALAAQFPQHGFEHLPERWWHDGVETPEQVVARAAEFRALMAGRPDQASTVLVSHWGFLLALSGVSVANGEILEYDPAGAVPEELVWRP